MAQIEQEEAERTRARREGREHGKLSHSLVEKIQACNPKQLKRVIELARENLHDHKKAPGLRQVRVFGTLLDSAAYRNKLYTLELRACGKQNCRKCPHGPYVFAFQKNGQYYPPRSQPVYSRLPKPIRERFAPILEAARLRLENAQQMAISNSPPQR
jgi:hypothetical protein